MLSKQLPTYHKCSIYAALRTPVMSPCNPLYPEKGQSHVSSTPLFSVLQKSPFSSFSSSIFHIGHEGGGWPNRPLLSISVPLLSPHFPSLLPSFLPSFSFPSFPFPISFPVSGLHPSPPWTRGGRVGRLAVIVMYSFLISTFLSPVFQPDLSLFPRLSRPSLPLSPVFPKTLPKTCPFSQKPICHP